MLMGKAFAPAAISNFFTVQRGIDPEGGRLMRTGATGGGYALSSGVVTAASLARTSNSPRLRISVNGDPNYEATTTRTGVELLMESLGEGRYDLALEQTVSVRVGFGFGASAASALSAVMAVASAASSRMSREEVAYFAHAADILCNTGLGTVSVIYKYGGAGLIVTPGAPGVAKVRRVKVPRGVRIVAASLAPVAKGPILSSVVMTKKINKLGNMALQMAEDRTLESLTKAGEMFSEGLGIATPRVRRLARVAKLAGALGASQNMVGEAVHAVVWERDAERVAAAMKKAVPMAAVDIYSLSSGPAALL